MRRLTICGRSPTGQEPNSPPPPGFRRAGFLGRRSGSHARPRRRIRIGRATLGQPRQAESTRPAAAAGEVRRERTLPRVSAVGSAGHSNSFCPAAPAIGGPTGGGPAVAAAARSSGGAASASSWKLAHGRIAGPVGNACPQHDLAAPGRRPPERFADERQFGEVLRLGFDGQCLPGTAGDLIFQFEGGRIDRRIEHVPMGSDFAAGSARRPADRAAVRACRRSLAIADHRLHRDRNGLAHRPSES